MEGEQQVVGQRVAQMMESQPRITRDAAQGFMDLDLYPIIAQGGRPSVTSR